MPVKRSLGLLSSQAILVVVFHLLFVPLMAFGFEAALHAAGLSYVTFGNLGRFLLHPVTLLFLATILIVSSGLILFEDVFLKEYFYARRMGIRAEGGAFFFHAVSHVLKAFGSCNLREISSAWTRMIVFNLPLMVFTVRTSRFFGYLKGELSAFWIWAVMLAGYALLACWMHRKHLLLLRRSFGWNALQAVAYLAAYAVLMGIAVLIISISVERPFAVAALIAVRSRVHSYFVPFLLIASTLTQYARYALVGEELLGLSECDLRVDQNVSYRQLVSTATRRMGVLGLVCLLLFDIHSYVGILKNGSALEVNATDQIQITSHRGYSYGYPENTLPAIERAIEAYADSVEVDVRATKDGEFVLLHDASLKRTTGLDKFIWDVTYDEIKFLDAGKWRGLAFEGTTIPTLRQVFDLAKGRVFLNLDLKYVSTQPDVVENLVGLIHEFEMEYQCIVTSTCLQCIEDIKAVNPGIQTGYITYRLTPALLKNPSIDAFSVKGSLVTGSVVEQVHASGKKMLVWTVNSKRDIERLSRLGVDNLITDRPAYAKEVLFRSTGNRHLVSLLKVVME
ncbi:glycerophosphodiester phosphodiesterase family protein [Anaerotalea alkaliphila]|uniref:GP-PDE domain-containing protein n=1 Tax=Anaerotalea alkaliphila TaxID=2662126 RepID=A0A7X5HUR1_9FIRM|nr:glycerophosphodiester phosphodiesterase family protein [Anaerotalea alkaliphila]NDL67040.1 hypothetical protein [Anaerotalea alkaliphila]